MVDELKNIDIKQIKGISFKCKECSASFSVPFATQQLYANSCPNCGIEWIDYKNYSQIIGDLKYAFEFLSKSGKADISLTTKD